MNFSFSKFQVISPLLVLITLLLNVHVVLCEKEVVRIEIKEKGKEIAQVEVVSFNKLSVEQQSLAVLNFDKSERRILEVDIEKPKFLIFKVDSILLPIYLEKDYDLVCEISNSGISFTGEGNKVNNYLVESDNIASNYSYLQELDMDNFLNQFEELKKALSSHIQTFLDSNEIDPEIVKRLELRNQIVLLNKKQIYGWNYAVQNSFIVPDQLQVEDQIPVESLYFQLGMKEYLELWHIYMHIRYFIPTFSSSDDKSDKPTIINYQIMKGDYPNHIEEFLLAKNIDYWLGRIGLKPNIEKLYDKFIIEHPKSIHQLELENHIDKWNMLSSGKDSPQILGKLMNDEKFDSKKLLGKVLYIDVWASWCKPCIDEIPYSINLKDQFSEKDEIVFLNISVDEDEIKWKKLLLNYPEWKGVHIINDGSIINSYQINGFPRYIIVDKKGKIVDSDALRPSAEKILYSQLNKLLED